MDQTFIQCLSKTFVLFTGLIFTSTLNGCPLLADTQSNAWRIEADLVSKDPVRQRSGIKEFMERDVVSRNSYLDELLTNHETAVSSIPPLIWKQLGTDATENLSRLQAPEPESRRIALESLPVLVLARLEMLKEQQSSLVRNLRLEYHGPSFNDVMERIVPLKSDPNFRVRRHWQHIMYSLRFCPSMTLISKLENLQKEPKTRDQEIGRTLNSIEKRYHKKA